jgi:hypothetical protein
VHATGGAIDRLVRAPAHAMRDFDLRHSDFRSKGFESRRGRKRLKYSA